MERVAQRWRAESGATDVAAQRALATLSEANRVLIRSVDESALLQQMCVTITETGGYPLSWYGRPFDDDAKSVRPVAVAGVSRAYLDDIDVSWGDDPLGMGPTGTCIRSKQTQTVHDLASEPTYAPWREAAATHGFQCSISLPVIVNGQLDGALIVYANEPNCFDEAAQSLLEDLAADLGYGLDRLRGRVVLERTVHEAREQREQLQATLDSLLDPFVLLEAVRDDRGRIVDLTYTQANEAALADNQVTRGQLIGMRLLTLLPSHLTDGPLAMYFNTIETGEPIILDDFPYRSERAGDMRRYDIRGVRIGDAIALTWRDNTERSAAAAQLAESEQRYRLLAENSSDVVLLADEHMVMHWVSPSALQAFGQEPSEIVGHSAADFIHPDDLAGLRAEVVRGHVSGSATHSRFRWRCGDGAFRWVDSVTRSDDENLTGRVVGLRDIDDQVRAEADLAAREEHYRLLAENASDVVWQIAPDGTVAWVSMSVVRVLGWQPAEILGTVASDLIHPDDRARMFEDRNELLAGRRFGGEYRFLRKDGSARWMGASARVVATDAGMSRIVSMRDIQDEVASRSQLEFALEHDQLTGLPTRRAMVERIDVLQRQSTADRALAVLSIDIDGLSAINEALTHDAGDVLLCSVASRIASAAPTSELVARGNGDEFFVVLPSPSAGDDAASLAELIRASVDVPLTLDGQEIVPTVSIGIASGTPEIKGERLLRDASLAMRKAKVGGGNRSEFADPALGAQAHQRLSLQSEIRDGLRDGQFVPWFQPIVLVSSADVVGYEALARWVRGDDVVQPAGFLPVAESTPMIHDLDIAILRQSVEVLAQLPEPQFVAVNVTAGTLARTPYADLVLAALADSGADPSRLHLEVTETMLLDLTQSVPEVMKRLAGVGVRWYVDDFGTGYSSISHLRDMPIAGLKLDRSFTSAIGAGDAKSMRLADGLIGLARGLGLDTVAEGVETRLEADYLTSTGWRHGQGWLYGQAAPFHSR